MVSTVTDPRASTYFNRRLWPVVRRHTNLGTTSGGQDDPKENFVQVVRLRRQGEPTETTGHNDTAGHTSSSDRDTADDDTDDTELSWDEARRDLLDFVSHQIELHYERANSDGIDHYTTPATQPEKRDRKGRLISAKNAKSADELLREYRRDVAVVLGQTYMALLASYLATTHTAAVEVVHETQSQEDTYGQYNNNNDDSDAGYSSTGTHGSDKKQSMAMNERATRLLLTVARHQERVLGDPRLATLREKNQLDFKHERESGYKREFYLLDILRDVQEEQQQEEEE